MLLDKDFIEAPYCTTFMKETHVGLILIKKRVVHILLNLSFYPPPPPPKFV